MADLGQVLAQLPKPLGGRLSSTFTKIRRNYYEGRYEPSQLNGEKFAEGVFRVLEWKATGHYTPLGTAIGNFQRECLKFENRTQEPDSVRFHIPRILIGIYNVRNKRGVGHLAGDVDANLMDATYVVTAANWIMAELVRLFHPLDLAEAQALVESLVTRIVPLVWTVGDRKRILDPKMSMKERTLVLLYSEPRTAVKDAALFEWIEHSNFAVFRRDVLRRCHRAKLIEYDEATSDVLLSPLGARFVEENVQLTLD